MTTRRARQATSWSPPPSAGDLVREVRDVVADLPRFLPHAQYRSTRAITIGANPEEIWPWLVQVGYRRVGWYAGDLLDNFARTPSMNGGGR